MASLSAPESDVNALVQMIRNGNLLNRQLSNICQVNGLKSAGVKLDLQNRIIARKLGYVAPAFLFLFLLFFSFRV